MYIYSFGTIFFFNLNKILKKKKKNNKLKYKKLFYSYLFKIFFFKILKKNNKYLNNKIIISRKTFEKELKKINATV